MDGVHKLDELRGRLAGLSRLLAGAEVCSSPPGPLGAAAAAAAPAVTAVSASPSRPRPAPGHAASLLRLASSSKPGGGSCAAPPFKTVVPPSKSVLRAANQPVAVGPAYAAFKEEEARWLAQKGELQLMLNREKKRSGKLEAELKRAQEMHAYRVGEVKHLKGALRQRDEQIVELQDRLRELELAGTGDRLAREAVEQAQVERDELRGAVQEMLGRLSAANEVIAHTDQSIQDMEAKVRAMDSERQEAVCAASAAAAESDALRQQVADLEWKCGMLQQLADMTLQQNEEKMGALRQLLQSESLLDGGAADEAADALSELNLAGGSSTTLDSAPCSP